MAAQTWNTEVQAKRKARATWSGVGGARHTVSTRQTAGCVSVWLYVSGPFSSALRTIQAAVRVLGVHRP